MQDQARNCDYDAQINNGGGFYGPQVYVEEARLLGVAMLSRRVRWSGTMCEVAGGAQNQ